MPRLGLALLGVIAIAAGVAAWFNVTDSAPRDRARAATTSPPRIGSSTPSTSIAPSAGGTAASDGGTVEVAPPPTTASGLPTAIDQPWAPAVSPGSAFTFEFPVGYEIGLNRVDALGLEARTLTASPAPPVGAPLACSEVDFSQEQLARGTLDLTSQEAIAKIVAGQMGVTSPQVEVIPTFAGPGTRFGGTTGSTSVRGFVVTASTTALWCVLTLSEAQATLGSLTIQRIVATVAVNGSAG